MNDYFELIWHIPQLKTIEGEVYKEAVDKKHIIPFGFNETIYYIFQKRKKWCIRKSKIDEIIFTNIPSVRLDNGWTVNYTHFDDRIFRENELDKAIELCEKQNRLSKVKIYNKDSWQ